MNAPLSLAPVRVVVAGLRDDAAWARGDAFVRAHPDGQPFHLSAWAGAIADGCGQPAHLLVAERGGVIAGVLPLTELHSPIFGRRLVSAGFGVGGGMLVDDPAAGQVLAALAAAAADLARRLSCAGVELRGGPAPAGWHVDAESYAGFVRPLAVDDTAELLAVPRKQRAELRKALALPLEVETGRGARDLAAHFAVYAESVRNLGTPVFPRRLFSAVLDRFGADADILTVRHEGQAVASVLSLYWRGTVMPYWGGGTRVARALRANDAMYFALMRHARARGCTAFDFGRSKAGTGAWHFKRNWGFVPQPLAYAGWRVDGGAPERVNPLDHGAKVRLWQALPLAIANRIGPAIARGLG